MSTQDGTFSEVLRMMMARRGCDQRELAGRSGIHFSTVCRYLNGERNCSIGAVDKIARALDLFPDEENHLRHAAGFAALDHPALVRFRAALATAPDGPRADLAVAMVEAAALYLRSGP